jgi:hypothetical protein
MRHYFLTFRNLAISLFLLALNLSAQPDALSFLGIPRFTSVEAGSVTPNQAASYYNTDDSTFYFYNGSAYIPINSAEITGLTFNPVTQNLSFNLADGSAVQVDMSTFTGATGPIGPAGAVGATGATGLSGATGATGGVPGLFIVTASDSPNRNTPKTVDINCTYGKKVAGAGIEMQGTGAYHYHTVLSYPTSDSTWQVTQAHQLAAPNFWVILVWVWGGGTVDSWYLAQYGLGTDVVLTVHGLCYN